MLQNGFAADLGILLERNDRTTGFPPTLIGYPDHGDFANFLQFVEDVLDLCGIDVFATLDVHVFQPILDVDKAFRIARPDIPRA